MSLVISTDDISVDAGPTVTCFDSLLLARVVFIV